MPVYLSRSDGVGGVACGCSACIVAPTIDLFFDGVSIACPSCIPFGSNWISITDNGLTGPYTLNVTGDPLRWELSGAYTVTYDIYSDEGCTALSGSGTTELDLAVDCVNGFYGVSGFVFASVPGELLRLFGAGLIVINGTGSNIDICGGEVTVTP